jgi:hypothetical protein
MKKGYLLFAIVAVFLLFLPFVFAGTWKQCTIPNDNEGIYYCCCEPVCAWQVGPCTPCYQYTDPSSCQSFGCQWCDECLVSKYVGQPGGRCVDPGYCSYYYSCSIGQCSATCSSTSDASWSDTTCLYNCDTASTCTYQSSCITNCSEEEFCKGTDNYCYFDVSCTSAGCAEIKGDYCDTGICDPAGYCNTPPPCVDSDGDGYGVCPYCDIANECTYDGNDCDDDPVTGFNINPGQTEICDDLIDNDCDGLIDCLVGYEDPDCGCVLPCIDYDGDGYGVCPYCSIANGCTYDGDDCDDNPITGPDIFPGQTEDCVDGIDNDCDEDYTGVWDDDPNTGIDCKDSADCAVSVCKCEDDCTYEDDNFIHRECDGTNGCKFCDPALGCDFCDNSKVGDSCDLAQPGWVRSYDDPVNCPGGCVIQCAEGCPEGKVKTDVSCSKENLIKVTKLVTYRGKLTKLVVVTCG